MSRLFCRSVVCAALVMSLPSVLWAKPKGSSDEKVDNPVYSAWVMFKPGTVAVWKVVKKTGDEETTETIEQKLVEIKNDRVILKKTTRSDGDAEPETKTVSVAKMISADKARVWTDPVGKTDEREETISVLKPKKKFQARVLESTKKGKNGETTTTLWLSDEAPGLLIKRKVVAEDETTTTVLSSLTQPGEDDTIANKGGKGGKSGRPKAAKFVWHTNYEKALAEAKTNKKLVLLDFTGSDWCGWCIKLDKEVFATSEFKKWAGDRLVLVKLDFPRRTPISEKLKQQNQKLAEKHGIQGFPTLVIVDANGKEVGKLGYVAGGPKNWITEAEKLLSSVSQDSSVTSPADRMASEDAR